MQPTKPQEAATPEPFVRRQVVAVSLDPHLLARLRGEVRFGKSISRMVEDAIRKFLDE